VVKDSSIAPAFARSIICASPEKGKNTAYASKKSESRNHASGLWFFRYSFFRLPVFLVFTFLLFIVFWFSLVFGYPVFAKISSLKPINTGSSIGNLDVRNPRVKVVRYLDA
jgi:hypothetical protein